MDFLNEEAVKMFESIRENELEKAEVYFDDSLRKSLLEQDVEGLADFAAALHQAGFLDEARDAYLLLKEMTPEWEEWDLFLAEIAIDQNRVEEGLDILLQFDESSELYPQALLSLADAYQVMGLYEVSEHKLKEAMDVLPDEPVIKFALAKLYHTNGKYPQAITSYEQLLQTEPEWIGNENLYILLADCKNAIGDFETAIQLLEQLNEEDHTSDSLFQLGISYFQIHEYGRATYVLQDLISKDPDYIPSYFYLAKSLEEVFRFDEALQAVKEGIQLDPFQAEFYLAAGTLLLKLKQPEEAEKQVEKALELEPELADALLLKVDLLMQADRYEEVVEIVEQKQTDILLHPQFYWKLALAYEELEEYEQAAEAFNRVQNELDDNLLFLKDFAQFLLEEGNRPRLQEVIERGLLLYPEEPFFIELREEHLNDY